MLFKLKERADELKTPKIPKRSLPDSDTISLLKAGTPPPSRRHSTTATRTTIGNTPAVGLVPLFPNGPSAPAESSARHSSAIRGGPSQKHTHVSSVPMKTYDGKGPPKGDDQQKPPRPSAMSRSRRNSEAGGVISKPSLGKTVNFVLDQSDAPYDADGYATDSVSPLNRKHPIPCRTGAKDLDVELSRPATRRDVRIGESSGTVWRLDVAIEGGISSHEHSGSPKKLDGYSTDADSHPRREALRSHHGRTSRRTHSIKGEASQSETEMPTVKASPEYRRENLLRISPQMALFEERPPGLHPTLLADASGRPPLRFNIAFPPAPPYLKTWHDIPRIIDDADLEVSATETGLTTMVIQLKCEPLPPWERVIRKREAVTCKDVFDAIWKEYDAPLTESEKAKIPKTYMHLYEKGFKKRCNDAPALTAVEERHGLKRVDLLLGRSFYRGMTKPQPNLPWVVELQMPPRGLTS